MECCNCGGGGGGCDLVEGENPEVGGGGVGRGGVFFGGDPPGELAPPHWDLLQSTGRAASEEHSREDRWSGFPGMQFRRPSPVTAEQAGASPVK